jgi:hypothetical protein
MRTAFRELQDVHDAVDRLAAVRCQRTWNATEHNDYLNAAALERRAMRDYIKSRQTFDALRWRILRRRSEENELTVSATNEMGADDGRPPGRAFEPRDRESIHRRV